MNNFTQISNDIIKNKDLTPYEKSVLGVLKSFNPCYPSYNDIAKYSGMSISKAKKTVQQLKDQNIITYIPGKTRVGKWHNEYTINPSGDWILASLNTKIKKIGIKKTKSINTINTKKSVQSTPSYNNNINNNNTTSIYTNELNKVITLFNEDISVEFPP